MWSSGLKCEFESHHDRTKNLSAHKSNSNIYIPVYTSKIKPRIVRIRFIYTVRQKLSTTWLISIISFLIMNLFQIGLLFSLPVHTHLLTCETGYWSIFIDVYMTGCVKSHVYFSTFVFANKSWFVLCRVLSFIFHWFGMVQRKLSIPERWQAVGMHNSGFSHRRVAAFLSNGECYWPSMCR